MKKIILSISVISALFATSIDDVFSKNSNNTNVSKDQLIKEIKKLKSELKKLREYVDENLDDLNERVDENEFQAALNKIKWSGEVEVTDGYFKGQNTVFDPTTNTAKVYKYSNPNEWLLRLKLNMEAFINEKTKFTGRLIMSKNWADYSGYSTVDSMAGRNTNSGPTLFVERAYIDYKIFPNLILTAGRQPSSDGPGMSLKYDTPRKATYPALLFNGAADGIVITYKPKVKFVNKPAIRVAYGKGYQKDHNLYGENAKLLGKDTNVYAALAEGKIKNIGDNLLILSYVRLQDLAGFDYIIPDLYQQKNSPVPTIVPVPNGTNVGDMNVYGIYFEQNKIKNKFNYFISAAMNDPEPKGSNSPLIKKVGKAYHIGARYDFSKKFKVGAEYNMGTKYWFSMNPSSLDPLNKLNVRGNAEDYYIIYRPDLYNLFRIGFTRVNYHYTFSGSYIVPPNGEPTKTDDYAQVFYLTYDVRF